jgi:hypothetical protein
MDQLRCTQEEAIWISLQLCIQISYKAKMFRHGHFFGKAELEAC